MTLDIVIVDYGSGNLRSVAKAVTAAADQTQQPTSIHVTSHADKVAQADYLILPGVGAFADGWAGLNAIDGMAEAITSQSHQQPFLGICVGMQLMAEIGEEGGVETPGFGWIGGRVTPLTPNPPEVRVPHMGWNNLSVTAQTSITAPVFAGLADDAWVYFLHGYHMVDMPPAQIAAVTDYGGEVVAAVADGTRLGVQFHPEKSQGVGQKLLTNWLNWRP